MIRGAEKRLLGGEWGEGGEWGVWREKGGNRVRGGGEKNIRVIFCWRILILDAPKHLCQQNFDVATPENTYCTPFPMLLS